MPRSLIQPVYDGSKSIDGLKDEIHYYFVIPGNGIEELREHTQNIPLGDPPRATRVSPDQTIILLNYYRNDVDVGELRDLTTYCEGLGGKRIPYFAIDQRITNVKSLGRGWAVLETSGIERVRV